MPDRVHDFHTHTFLSDGALAPVELIRRALVRGYAAIGIADHAGPGNVEWVVKQLVEDCRACERYWDIVCLPGVEITHTPPALIPEIARAAKAFGAKVVVVHGETPVEPVEPGTNRVAVQCADVDVLGHPGFITPDEGELAAKNGVFVEVTARRGHSLCNGHVVQVGRAAGVRFVVDSDGHEPGDLLTWEHANKVARGAGLSLEETRAVLVDNPKALLLRALGRERV